LSVQFTPAAAFSAFLSRSPQPLQRVSQQLHLEGLHTHNSTMADLPQGRFTRDLSHDSLDDAEKGMHDTSASLTAPPPFAYLGQEKALRINTQEKALRLNTHLSPLSPLHEGITPNPSIPDLSLSWPAASPAVRRGSINAAALKTSIPPKPTPAKAKVPRWVLADLWFNTYRKFFTFIILLNLAGIIMTALGRFPYAENHLGALVLGNLLSAILFRNELWMRFLYMVAIYGLRSVSTCHFHPLSRTR
jgi:hypothetical protein